MEGLRVLQIKLFSVCFVAAIASCSRFGRFASAHVAGGNNPGRNANDEPFLHGLSATDTYFASYEPSPRPVGNGASDKVNPAFWDAAKYLKLAEAAFEGDAGMLDDEEVPNDDDKVLHSKEGPTSDFLAVEGDPGKIVSEPCTEGTPASAVDVVQTTAETNQKLAEGGKVDSEEEDTAKRTTEMPDRGNLRGEGDSQYAVPYGVSSAASDAEEFLSSLVNFDSSDIRSFILFLWSLAVEKLKVPASMFFELF